ncbi:hypothetical protein DFA_10612 [Cavenderia fasciculata]|uniref:Methylosome subunit pICln n=1 Tax=Cavenderia fasciculata TaxID=261658 RepID=F4QAQ0_CACFS|nr:uncharacterized protein DFA_10612 [Cavenderia fasciculata]EGG15769.1 hypothetical protein DFA_10612 [Cavenderia fasciculata]|eukprot:XP_004354516.1 hypothetical protein DFA_10612 [Cavenderia fasciculata]
MEVEQQQQEQQEETIYQLENVQLVIDTTSLGSGSLIITNRFVKWNNSTQYYRFSYFDLGLNAILSATQDTPACIYSQYDQIIQLHHDTKNNNTNGKDDNQEDEEEDEEEEASQYTELKFIPFDTTKIQEIYDAICKGELLNPDPEEQGEGNFYYGQPLSDDDDDDEDQEEEEYDDQEMEQDQSQYKNDNGDDDQ